MDKCGGQARQTKPCVLERLTRIYTKQFRIVSYKDTGFTQAYNVGLKNTKLACEGERRRRETARKRARGRPRQRE